MSDLQCCINGARAAGEHPAVATTPEAGATQAASAVRAGATELHIHPKTREGRDSLAPEDVAAWLTATRGAVDVPIGVTTGAWAWPGRRSAAEAIADWTVLPDDASVNWHEPAAQAICAALADRGVSIHVGLWSVDDATDWSDSPWRERTTRVLVELPDVAGQETVAEAILEIVAPSGVPVLLHGEERSAWPMIDLALARRVPTRIGLEDVLHGPDGEDVVDNADLIGLVRERAATRS